MAIDSERRKKDTPCTMVVIRLFGTMSWTVWPLCYDGDVPATLILELTTLEEDRFSW